MKLFRLFAGCVCVGLAALSGVGAGAQTPSPARPPASLSPLLKPEVQLPPFTLWTSNGTTIDNAHLNPGGFWLMLYRDLSSPRGDDALALLESLNSAPAAANSPSAATAAAKLDPSRLVVVLTNATGAQVSQMQLDHPLLAGSVWLRDEKALAAAAIGVHGSPHLIGMHENARRWQLAGSIEAPETKTAVLEWLANNSRPQNKLVKHKMKTAPPPARNAEQAAAAAALARSGGSQ